MGYKTMTTLLIKTKDNKIYEERLPCHFLIAEKHSLNYDNILMVGFKTRNRIVWEDRKPD